MPGSYCRYCGHRCFVERSVMVADVVLWRGYMATCRDGAAHDRHKVGVDHTRAHNPAWGGIHCTGPCCKTPANPTPGGNP